MGEGQNQSILVNTQKTFWEDLIVVLLFLP